MKCILLLAIVACASAQFYHFTADVKKGPARRSFSSSFSSSSGFSSGYTSGGSPATPSTPTTTPAPTPAATVAGSTTIKQVISMTFPGLASVAAFAGSAHEKVANFGYGSQIGIVDSGNSTGTWVTQFKSGCSVTSVAVAARRTALSVTFTAVVTPTLASAAQSSASAITPASLAATMTTVLSNLKNENPTLYNSVTTPTVQSVATPTVTTAGGSASSTAALSAVAFVAAAALALKQ